MSIRSILLALCLCGAQIAAVAVAADLAIVGVRVYAAPDAEARDDATVLVRDGRIHAVGAAAEIQVPHGMERIDGAGKVLVAGFWNSHVHLLSPVLADAAARSADELAQALQDAFTRWGFTTVFDLAGLPGNTAALRRRVEAGELEGPAILHVDAPFYPQDGTPIYAREFYRQRGAPSAEVATAEEARARARRQIADGADGVKVFAGAIVGGPVPVLPLDVDIARAVVEEAHAAGKPAFAHPSDPRGIEIALAAGVDVLAHTTAATGPWGDDLVRRLREADVALVPTLTLFDHELRKEQAPAAVLQRFLDNATQQVRVYAAAGGTLLFGTDVDFIPQVDTRREFELLALAGLDWRQVLASLTTAPARRFGQDARTGRIAPGLQADLVLLDADPATDVTGFAEVHATIRGGRILYRKPD
ncbi:amidohydrolase family protein [Coralloluteibacterium thermophilus]|uniref:Amidohydrolase family protein n=1 Tax=Coralloluteibacterium thermophilum TaxID=2707049 RepID=A0ABV9NG40_9GAMM